MHTIRVYVWNIFGNKVDEDWYQSKSLSLSPSLIHSHSFLNRMPVLLVYIPTFKIIIKLSLCPSWCETENRMCIKHIILNWFCIVRFYCVCTQCNTLKLSHTECWILKTTLSLLPPQQQQQRRRQQQKKTQKCLLGHRQQENVREKPKYNDR